MNLKVLTVSFLSAVPFTLTGCATQPPAGAGAQRIDLATMGPAREPHVTRDGVMHLGAGDSIGEALYDNYVEYARINGDTLHLVAPQQFAHAE